MDTLSEELRKITAKAKEQKREKDAKERKNRQEAFDSEMRAQQITKAKELIVKIPDLLREKAGLEFNAYPLRESEMIAWHPDAVKIVTDFLTEKELLYTVTDCTYEFNFWKEYIITW